jgi:hypothetical protein
MNSDWAEQHARQHVDQMARDASGDRLVAEAARQASDRPEPAAPTPLRRARTRIQALAIRQLRLVARAR